APPRELAKQADRSQERNRSRASPPSRERATTGTSTSSARDGRASAALSVETPHVERKNVAAQIMYVRDTVFAESAQRVQTARRVSSKAPQLVKDMSRICVVVEDTI
ncbi:jg906, partial [Pararge aegeria aegeria]